MKKKLIYLIIISAIIRIIAASFTELGNDEVYYRILALFPDISYFDHPPMVSWLIGLTTFWNAVAPEFLVRLGSIIIGSLNIYLIYVLTQKMGGNEHAALLASILYTGSIYASIICGTFIMPDTPLILFWLLALIFIIDYINGKKNAIIYFGILVGLATLSKYTGGELWFGAIIYIILYNRKLLTDPRLYISILISLLIFSPVVIWNAQNDFITFTFHGERVSGGNQIELYLFFRELLGEFYYNNPITWVLTVIAIAAYIKGASFIEQKYFRLLASIAFPMIIIFVLISFTKETLPHWSAPAYITLMPITALYFCNKKNGFKYGYIACALIILSITLGIYQINIGPIEFKDDRGEWRLGSSDFSLDMYGWEQGAVKFDSIRKSDTTMPKDAPIIQYGWDDAAHIDCYFALPYGYTTKGIGDLHALHYWKWITEKRGGFKKGDCAWLITSSRFPRIPEEVYNNMFEKIEDADTIKIYRTGRHVMNFYVYKLYGLKSADNPIK